MKTQRRFVFSFLAACLLAAVAFAADASPAGRWKWTVQGRQGQGFVQELTLAYEQGRLSGRLLGRQGVPDTPIADATFQGGRIRFSVTREFNGNKFTTKFDGQLEGDAINGTFERSGLPNGPTTSEWHAKREK